MKALKSIALFMVLLGPLTATVAHADHFRHGPRVGVFIDPWPLYYPYYPWGYYPYGYPPSQVVVTQQAPTTYIEQGTPTATVNEQPRKAPPPSDWYYCRKPEGYYPYVRSCPDGWERVPAQPPGAR
ncbi:MAG: hypothetical protein JO269_10985 [Burkholderiaceae bacterium]|nr:hypothetical protein [Burkholderiaceae bacterium]